MPNLPQTKPSDPSGPFVGVYSESVTHTLGFGGTKRKQRAKTYWLIKRTATGELFIQALNKNLAPVGEKTRLSQDKFLADYCPEPDLYMAQVQPRMREMEEAIRKGDAHRVQEEFYSAEIEYQQALDIDEDEIRANFGLGLTYLGRGDADKARYVFQKIVGLPAAFRAEHKHLFNEFGIALRRSRLLDEAVRYYARALQLCNDGDDHLLFNIARACFEQGQFTEAHGFVRKALEQAPDFPEAMRLLKAIIRRAPSLMTGGCFLREAVSAHGAA